MYGGALLVASKKKRKLTKEEYLSEAEDDEEASEPQKKKAKKAKVVGSDVLSIQREVQDLEPAKVLNKRTRGGKSAETSQPQPAQNIPKKKRKHHTRKMKESSSVIEQEEHHHTYWYIFHPDGFSSCFIVPQDEVHSNIQRVLHTDRRKVFHQVGYNI